MIFFLILNSFHKLSPRKKSKNKKQAPGDYFDAEPTFKQSYAPQSGQIFGILKQMKESFESNLSASQKEEMLSQQAYQDLKVLRDGARWRVD